MEQNFYTEKEELVNSITHGIGAVLAITGLVILVVTAAFKGTAWHVVSFSIYGATLVLLYLDSTLYHSFRAGKVKRLFRKFDHMSIYLLIAGTYTPFCLTVLRGPVGWTIFGVVWGCTVLGVILKVFATGKKDRLSTVMYVIMGWIIIIAFKALYSNMSTKGLVLLVAGGIAYTLGALIYSKDKIPYNHGVWHLFVMAGSLLHFFSVLTLLSI